MPITIKETTVIIETGLISYEYPKKIMIDGIEFEFLDAGNHNIAYKSVKEPFEVYKEPFEENGSDSSKRAVRVWNEINLTLGGGMCAREFKKTTFEILKIAKDEKGNLIKQCTIKNKIGWIAPFVVFTEQVKPSGAEICGALIDIYQKTGRIVVDGIAKNNFVKMNNNGNDQVVCIDIGAALKLEENIKKEASEASANFWIEMKEEYNEFFKYGSAYRKYKSIINTTKALLVLQHFRPDVKNLEELKKDTQLTEELAKIYDDETLSGKSVDIYSKFPINLSYFSDIELLSDFIKNDSINEENKKSLCLLYLKQETKTYLLRHLLPYFQHQELIDNAAIEQIIEKIQDVVDPLGFLSGAEKFIPVETDDEESDREQEPEKKSRTGFFAEKNTTNSSGNGATTAFGLPLCRR